MFTGTKSLKIFIICILSILLGTRALIFAGEDRSGSAGKGSISIILQDPLDESAINEVDFWLYAVAEPASAAGDNAFVYIAAFENCGLELDPVPEKILAGELAVYAVEQNLTAADSQKSENGRIYFSGLADGLYLLVQKENAAGYSRVSPFVVSLPSVNRDGSLLYELVAKPKMEKAGTPDPGFKPQPEPELPAPEKDRLIQTGQLNWPLPVLAATGFACFSYGWLAFSKNRALDIKKDNKDEEKQA